MRKRDWKRILYKKFPGLLNIRGADIPFTPVVFSIVILAHNGAHLFIDLRKLDEGTRRYLEKYVTVHEYDEAIEWIIDWNTRTSRLNLHKVILVVQGLLL